MKVASLEIELLANVARLQNDMSRATRTVDGAMQRIERSTAMAMKALGGLAAAFSVRAIAQQVTSITKLASRYNELGIVMNTVGRNAGYTRGELAQLEVDLKKTGISALESRSNIAKLVAANIDLSKATELARLAQDAAVIGGLNSSDAFARLTSGIQSAQVETLRTMGLNANFQKSYEDLAAELGKTTKELTELEKTQARTNAVLALAPTVAGAYEASMTNAGKALRSAERYAENLQVALGEAFQPVFVVAVDAYSNALKSAIDNVDLLKRSMIALTLSTLPLLVAGLTRLAVTIVPMLTARMWSLTAAMLSNPITAIPTLISMAIAAYVMFDEKLEGTHDFFVKTGEVWQIIFDDVKKVTDELKKEVVELWGAFKDLTGDTSPKTWTDMLIVGLARVADVAALVVRTVGAMVTVIQAIIKSAQYMAAFVARPDALSRKFAPEESARLEQEYQDALKASVAATERAAEQIAGLWTEPANKYEQAALKIVNTQRVVTEEVALVDLTVKKATETISDSTTELGKNSKALSEAQKAAAAFRKEQEAALRARYDSISAIHQEAQGIEDQVYLFGLGKTAIEDLTIARLEEEATVLRLYGDKSALTVEAIEREIEARKRLRTAIGSLEQREAEQAAWDAWAQDMDRVFQQVGQSLTDQLFDGGKSARDMIRDLFKSLVLRVAIQPIMGSIQSMVTNQLGGMLSLQNPGGNVLGMAQNAYSGYNAATGGLSGTLGNAAQWLGNKVGSQALHSFGLGLSGATAATGITSIGASLGASLGTTIGTSAASMATTTFSASLGGAAAGGAAAGGSAAAGGAAGLGAAFGAALPWIGGALAVGSMFGLFGDDTPKTRHGQRARVDFAGDIFDITSTDDRQPGAESSVQQMVKQAVQSANAVFQQAGIDAAIDTFYAMTESSVLGDRQGVASGGMLRIGDALRQIGIRDSSDMTFAGFGGWSEADMLPRLATDIQLSILEAFQSAGVMSDLLDGVHIRGLGEEAAAQLATTIQTIVSEVAAFQDAIVSLPFANLQGLAFDAARGLIAAAGGLENLNAGLSSYYDTYYSEAEKLDRISAQVQKALEGVGLVMPDVTQGADSAKAAFRALFESLDPTTEAGQQAVAAMLGVNQAFAQLVDGLDEMGSAAEQAALKAKKAAWDLLVGEGESAFAALTRSVSAEKTRLQKESEAIAEALRSSISAASQTVNELTGLTGRLTSTLQRMTGQLDPAANFAWAQERIDRALSVAKLTGVMPEGADFEQALQIVASPSEGLYSSFEDYQADFLKTAHTINELNELADGQLSIERRSLTALENQLTQSQHWYQAEMERLDLMLETQLRELEMAMGTYEAVLTIPQALENIAAAIAAIELNAPAPSYSAPGVFNDQLYLEGKLAELAGGGYVPDDFTGPMTTGYLREYLAGVGMTPEQHYQRYGQSEGIDDYIRQLRGYASGGFYPGGMALVGERGPELINFAQPGQVYTANQTQDILRSMQGGGGSDKETKDLLRQIVSRLDRLENIDRNTYETARSSREMTEQPQPVVVTNVVPVKEAVIGS